MRIRRGNQARKTEEDVVEREANSLADDNGSFVATEGNEGDDLMDPSKEGFLQRKKEENQSVKKERRREIDDSR